eukprot:2510331-Rhodomonas_salina.3
MRGEGEKNTLYSAALRGLHSMTLGDKKSSEKLGQPTPPRRASESELLGQLPRANKFSPAEIVQRLRGSQTEEDIGHDRTQSLQWQVLSVQDRSMSTSAEDEQCVFCSEGFKAGASIVLCKQGKDSMHPHCWLSRKHWAKAIICQAAGLAGEGKKVNFQLKDVKVFLQKKLPVLAADWETVSFWADENRFECWPARDFTTPRRPAGKTGNLSGIGRESKGSGTKSEG